MLTRILPGACKSQEAPPLPHTFSLWLAQTRKSNCQLLPGRSLCTHLELQLLWLPLEQRPLKSSSPKSQWISVFMSLTGPHKTKKMQVSKGTHAFPIVYPSRSVQGEQAKISIFQFLLERDLTAYFPNCVLSENLASNKFACRSWLGSFQKPERVVRHGVPVVAQ